jgi:hypothetical protein
MLSYVFSVPMKYPGYDNQKAKFTALPVFVPG